MYTQLDPGGQGPLVSVTQGTGLRGLIAGAVITNCKGATAEGKYRQDRCLATELGSSQRRPKCGVNCRVKGSNFELDAAAELS